MYLRIDVTREDLQCIAVASLGFDDIARLVAQQGEMERGNGIAWIFGNQSLQRFPCRCSIAATKLRNGKPEQCICIAWLESYGPLKSCNSERRRTSIKLQSTKQQQHGNAGRTLVCQCSTLLLGLVAPTRADILVDGGDWIRWVLRHGDYRIFCGRRPPDWRFYVPETEPYTTS